MSILFGSYQLTFWPFNTALPPINCPRWGPKETEFQDENIVWMSPKSDRHHWEGYSAFSIYYESWMLARLWHLSNGDTKAALNLNIDREACLGGEDGGAYYAYGIVHDATGEVVGHVHVEGYGHGYAKFTLFECSEDADPQDIQQKLADLLWEKEDEVAVCLIEIRDPEQQQKPYYYGWDGVNFRPKNEPDLWK